MIVAMRIPLKKHAVFCRNMAVSPRYLNQLQKPWHSQDSLAGVVGRKRVQLVGRAFALCSER